jgi:outer membrane protein assembly factor BamB
MTSSFSRHVGSQDNNVYALNASTGVPLWSYTTGGPVESSPAVANGVVYVGSDDNNIYAFAPLTGEELSYSILKSAWPDCHDLVEG